MPQPATITRLPFGKAPSPPKGLSRDGRRLWSELQSTYGVRDPAGLLLLETACKSFDDWAAARMQLDEEGLLIADRQGGQKLHPAAMVVKNSHAAMMQALRMMHFDVKPTLPSVGRPPGGKRP
jgi:phage terminase small subunit